MFATHVVGTWVLIDRLRPARTIVVSSGGMYVAGGSRSATRSPSARVQPVQGLRAHQASTGRARRAVGRAAARRRALDAPGMGRHGRSGGEPARLLEAREADHPHRRGGRRHDRLAGRSARAAASPPAASGTTAGSARRTTGSGPEKTRRRRAPSCGIPASGSHLCRLRPQWTMPQRSAWPIWRSASVRTCSPARSSPSAASRARSTSSARSPRARTSTGRKFVDVAWFDPWVKRARIEHARRRHARLRAAVVRRAHPRARASTTPRGSRSRAVGAGAARGPRPRARGPRPPAVRQGGAARSSTTARPTGAIVPCPTPAWAKLVHPRPRRGRRAGQARGADPARAAARRARPDRRLARARRHARGRRRAADGPRLRRAPLRGPGHRPHDRAAPGRRVAGRALRRPSTASSTCPTSRPRRCSRRPTRGAPTAT